MVGNVIKYGYAPLENYWGHRLGTIRGGFTIEWLHKSSIGDSFMVHRYRIGLLECIAFKAKNIPKKGGE